MESLSLAVYSRLDLVFFVYGISFSAMGLLLFVQPREKSSFAFSHSLRLLGWFGLIHGVSEFMGMRRLPGTVGGVLFDAVQTTALAASFLLLLEFGRRSLLALQSEVPGYRPVPAWLTAWQLTPALAAAVFIPASLSGNLVHAASLLSRPLLCFPGALMAGFAFLAYSRRRGKTLVRLKARGHFVAVGASLLAYAALGGLVVPGGHFFPADRVNADLFYSLVGLPVQLFRALCAAFIFGGVMGVLRIFREGALQAAQQELLDIIEFFPDATFVVDSSKRVIAWNRALERMTGVSKQEMLGKGDYAYSVPFYGHRRPILVDLIGRPDPVAEAHYKYVKKRADGAIYAEVFVPSLYGGKGAHVWVTASPLMDKDGNVYGAIESIRDITDRKLAEQALHQSEAQYRALIETTNTGFLIIDKEGRVLDANQEYVRLSGRKSLSEIRGRSVIEWTAPYEKERNAAAVSRCAADGCIRNFEVDYVDAAGTVTPVELNATVVEIAGVYRILALCRDISDRRRAEAQIRESEGKYRTLTERAIIGVYLIQDGVFKYVNPKMNEIFGYAPGELVEVKGPQDLVLPGDWPLVRENLRKRIEGEVPDANYAFRGVRKDGGEIVVEVFGSRIDYMGRPAVLGTLLDITERKRTQDAMRESEAMYRSLVDNAPVGIVVHQSGVMRFVNRKIVEIVRVKGPEEVLGRNVLQFIHL